jgi:secreted trypsin-like serine protease
MQTTVVVVLSALVAMANAQCGITPIPPDETRIVGGKNAVPFSWPWQGMMCMTATTGGACNLRCGSSVIDNSWILSAAHCVDGYTGQPTRFHIVVGTYNTGVTESGQVTAQVAQIYMHPNYKSPRPMSNDVALLRLSSPLTYTNHIRPVCLPTNIDDLLVANKNVFVTGWGTTSSGGSVSATLRQVIVPTVTNTQCTNQYGSSQIDTTMICAGIVGKDSCQGDSGGPMVVKRANGRWYQGGVVSWGQGCALASHAGVYARTSTQCNWIATTVGKTICVA